jgi:hypothetical protein
MFRTVVLTLSSLLAIPLVAAAQVRVDFDRHQSFAKYRTFDIEIGSVVRSDGVVDEDNTLAQNRLRRAIANELQSRGLEATELGADLLVRVSDRDTERTDIVSSGFGHYPGYWGGWYAYGHRAYWGPYGYWGGPYFNDVWTRRYVEKSVTVDVIERDSGSLVYRAQVSGEVGNDLDKHVTKAIDRAFKKFPVKELSN